MPAENSGFRRHRSSGNTAFDSYRDETLKRLEDEQKEFHAFVERLRRAKDQAGIRPVHERTPREWWRRHRELSVSSDT